MTAKDKAIDIITKYQNIEFLSTNLDEFGEKDIRNMGYKRAKQCALIAVGEIIETSPIIKSRISRNNCSWIESKSNIEYWQQVKQEIEKL